MQLENNVIISRQPEQPWESYESTKDCVIDTLAATFGPSTDPMVLQEARKVEIQCCSRVGHYKLNKPQPISVTFQ